MGVRDRAKISAAKLIELICNVEPNAEETTISAQLEEIRASVAFINQMASINKTEISTLKHENDEQFKKNSALKAEIELLKLHAQECKENRQQLLQQPPPPPPPNDEFGRVWEQLRKMQENINTIQQYIRVNNLEIVCLPDPNQDESEETLLVNALNEL